MGQDVAIERLTQLGAEGTAAHSTGEAAEDGTGYRAECDPDGAGDSANKRACLASGQRSADAARSTTHGTESRTDFHGVMERNNFRGVTTGALQ